jgi:hypothetical protein
MRFFVTLTNGQQRRIVFKHITTEKTVCRMDCIDPQTNKWVPWLSSLAVCAECDRPNKWLGRKIALARLTKSSITNKLDRHIIWKEYFSMLSISMFKKSNLATAVRIVNISMVLKECAKLTALWQGAINPKCTCKKELSK